MMEHFRASQLSHTQASRLNQPCGEMSLSTVGGCGGGEGLYLHQVTGAFLGNLLPDAGTTAVAVPGDPVRTGGQ